MPGVARPTLTQFIDEAMRLRHTDAARIERETGLDASWTRQFKAGRMESRPDPDRIHTLAGALGVDEAELWQYLGRYDMVAAIRNTPARVEEQTSVDLATALVGLTAELALWREERSQLLDRLEELEATVALLVERDRPEQGTGAPGAHGAPLASTG
jgi:transcriptional regulator with XRE-family HTH domain